MVKNYYNKFKIDGKCTYCGKKINNASPNLKCDMCTIKSRVSSIDSRLRKIEKFIDNCLKVEERNRNI